MLASEMEGEEHDNSTLPEEAGHIPTSPEYKKNIWDSVVCDTSSNLKQIRI